MTALRLGSFVAHTPVGHGGMATVWRGVHAPTDVPVALKVLDRTDKAPALDALRTELEAVASLSHPSILTLFDHGVVTPEVAEASDGVLEAGRPWMAMELATAGTLSGVARAFTWREIRATLDALLEALAHAHAHGVIHRDLKPSNVLLAGPADLRPGLKIADFGIAAAGEDRFRRRVAGTPRYMAPEQIRAAWRDIGPWTDLYALGGVAWELVTGAPPFGHGEPAHLTHRHLYETPPPFVPRTRVPDGFEAWVRRMLEKPVTARFQRAADARWALDRLEGAGWASAPSSAFRPPVIEGDTLAEMLSGTGSRTGATGGGSTLTDLMAAPGEPDDAPAMPPIEPSPPPIPEDWRLRSTPEPSPQLVGAGLALFGLRQVPLVGRHHERSILWHALRQVSATRCPQGVVLAGPAGVGKSALARWFAERADELGAATVWIARHEAGGAAAHGLRGMLIRSMQLSGLSRSRAEKRIRTWLGARGHDDPDDARALAAWLFPEAGLPSPFSTSTERHTLLTRVLQAAASERPVVLWLDDVPWGPSSLDLAADVLERAPELPVLVVMTAQAEALAESPSTREILDRLAERSPLTTLTMPALTTAELRRLVRLLLPLRDELVDALSTRADGNPLFAVQLLGDWIARGLLRNRPDGFDLADGQTPTIPDGLHEVWSDRVDRILDGAPEDTRLALELAAALGIQVREGEWLDALEVLGISPPTQLADALTRARLAVPTPDGWRFAHGMLHESLARDAAEHGAWARLNDAAATMLQDRPGVEALARRGRHLLHADRPGPAADVLLKAAAHHARLEEGPTTDRLLVRAAEALDACGAGADDLRRARWNVTAARVARTRRALERADTLATHAARVAAAHDHASLLATALTERALIARARGDLPSARVRMDEALERWHRADDLAGLAEALRHLADIAMQAGDLTAASTAIDEATSLAIDARDRTAEALALLLRGDLARTRSHWSEARTAYRAGLRILRAEGHRSGVSDGLAGLAEVQRYTGDVEAAEAGYREVARLDEALGRDTSVTRLNLALCLIARDRAHEALPLLEALERTWSTAGRPGYLAVLHVASLPCMVAVGRWSGWHRHYAEATRLLADSAFVDIDVARHADHAGVMALEADRPVEAREAWDIALAQWEALGDDARAEATERAMVRLSARRSP